MITKKTYKTIKSLKSRKFRYTLERFTVEGLRLIKTILEKGEFLESVFFTPDEKLTFISSSMVKELASYGGDISKFVHSDIAKSLEEKFNN